ncbi:MAG: LptF/LptG family permease [Rikenellaceae bacterium]
MKFKWPGIKILDRYILGKFLTTYFFAIAMIVVVIVVFDYVEKVDNFIRYDAPMKGIIFDYYLNFAPFLVNQFSGLFTFVAVIFFTSKMAYQTEIIAMLSGGMSFKRLMWPYFVGSLIISSISLCLNLWVMPISQQACVEFDAKYIHPGRSSKFDKHIYRQIEPGVFIYLRNYTNEQKAAYLSLEQYVDGELVGSLEASSAVVDKATGRWTAPRYITRKFTHEGDVGMKEEFVQRRNLDTLLNLTHAELSRIEDLLKTMNIHELNDFLEQQKSKGADSITTIEVAKHSRFAYPLGTFILALIGVSLSSRKVRGGTGLHIGIGTGLCFSYIMLNRFFEEFAKGGTMPPGVAVWLPNIIFMFIAVYCYRKAPK